MCRATPQTTSPALSKVSRPSVGSPCTTLRAFEILSGRASMYQGQMVAREGGVPKPGSNSTPLPQGYESSGGGGRVQSDPPNHPPSTE